MGRKCPTCGLIYVSPRPSPSEVRNLYREDRESAESHISAALLKRLHAKHNLHIIKKFIKNGSMLEIGSGAGYFLDEARKQRFEVYGIELNKIKANFIRNKLKIPCEESSLRVSSFEGKKFDIIYHCNVISHFYDPIREFKKINDKLKDKGMLVFETGNLGDVKEKYYRIFTRFQLPDHLFLFSEDNLKELLERTAFKFIKVYRYSILPLLLIFKFREKLGKIRETDRNSPTGVQSSSIESLGFEELTRILWHCFVHLIRYKIGYVMPKKERPQTIIVIARKRERYLT